jgi:gamma-glutamyltranspeptidase / glutathione hydrolase
MKIRYVLSYFLMLGLWVTLPAIAKAPEVSPKQAAIASANAAATDAGMAVLAKGGNAVDAAIAVSATLGLVEPESSGVGGGGFILIRTRDGREVFIDARERAPLAATKNMFLDDKGQPIPRKTVDGAMAAAIPGIPAAWAHMAKKYGRLPLVQSLKPTIDLANEGWLFGAKNTAMMGGRKAVLAKDPAAAALFLQNGEVPALGTRMKNPDYAKTIAMIARSDAKEFYQGEFANRMAAEVVKQGGIWSTKDLAQYKVVERTPLKFTHGDYTIVTTPPPSSGGVAIAEILNILDAFDYQKMNRVDQVHLMTESMRRAYRDRAIYLGDPDFVNVPMKLLMSTDYAAGLRAGISMQQATPSMLLPGVSAPEQRTNTSHFSIIDRDGNMVAVTQTVNLPYGNALVVPGTGFLLNNEMDDFSIKPGVPNAFGLVGEDANAIAPGKRPLSSMSPTFVMNKDRVAIIGTPGGSRIISMVLIGVMAAMDGAGAQAVADAPRFHHQYLPDTLSAEKNAFSAEEIAALQARGHKVEMADRTWGNMQVVIWDKKKGKVEAGSDSRWSGVGKASSEGSIFR